jgi:hypothetical protein
MNRLENGQRIDEFLPNHDFRAAYEVCINAPAQMFYGCLLRSELSDVRERPSKHGSNRLLIKTSLHKNGRETPGKNIPSSDF